MTKTKTEIPLKVALKDAPFAQPDAAHDHGACIEAALAAAERICLDRGSQFTPLRRQVLSLLWSRHGAIKAYDILAAMQANDRNAKPPTVYRALDFLVENGLAHRVESLNAFYGCPRPREAHDSVNGWQLLVCERCYIVHEVACDPVSTLASKAIANSGFRLRRRIVEMQGVCRECQIRHQEMEKAE